MDAEIVYFFRSPCKAAAEGWQLQHELKYNQVGTHVATRCNASGPHFITGCTLSGAQLATKVQSERPTRYKMMNFERHTFCNKMQRERPTVIAKCSYTANLLVERLPMCKCKYKRNILLRARASCVTEGFWRIGKQATGDN